MIARGFKPVAWVAAIGTAALGCYMLSLQVAAERAELASLDRQIVRTAQDIRSLETELGTRGRLQQLEEWNAEVLALSAPVAGQYLESGMTLARFDTTEQPGQVHDQVRLASAEVAPPSAPSAVAPSAHPTVIQARAELPVASAHDQSLVHRASLEISPVSKPVAARATAARGTTVRSAAATVRPPASAPSPAPSSSLLDAGTLREIGAQARTEQGQN